VFKEIHRKNATTDREMARMLDVFRDLVSEDYLRYTPGGIKIEAEESRDLLRGSVSEKSVCQHVPQMNLVSMYERDDVGLYDNVSQHACPEGNTTEVQHLLNLNQFTWILLQNPTCVFGLQARMDIPKQ
jgi:hypothetical protein